LRRCVTAGLPPVPHPKPATKLLDSRYSSDRGACGFVLTGNTEITDETSG
jgi:hypothetical protein